MNIRITEAELRALELSRWEGEGGALFASQGLRRRFVRHTESHSSRAQESMANSNVDRGETLPRKMQISSELTRAATIANSVAAS